MANCVKATVFLADIADFYRFNMVYKPFFPDFERPARSTVAVSGLFGGALVEIDLVCYVPYPERYIWQQK